MERSLKQTTFGFESCDHAGTVLAGLDALRKRKLLFDVTLVVDGQRFPAHRAVLAACSEYFRAMFTDAMKERQQEEIQLNGVSALGLGHLVDYAYTSRLSLDLRNIQAVLSAASHLQILPVIGACAEFLHREIDMENCVDIATISETFTLPALRKHAYCFIGKHVDRLKYCPEFNQRLSATQMEFLLSGDFPVACSEAEVFEVTLSWIHFDFASRWQCHEDLFACINFTEIALSDMLTVFYQGQLPVIQKEEYWKVIDNLQTKAARRRVLHREAVEAGLVNIRGMQKAIVNVGGFQSSTGATNTLTYLHSGSRVWHKLTSIPHLDQTDFGVTVLNNELYVTGGIFFEDNQESIHSYGFKYNPCTDEWTSIPGMNHDRCSFFLATVDQRIYAVGGNNSGTCECYDPEMNEWTDIDSVPIELDRYAGATIGDCIYISGGNDFLDDPVDTLWEYEVSTNCWSQRAAMLSPRADHDMVGHSGKLYIAGGWSRTQNNQRLLSDTLDVYDKDSDQWHTLTQLPNPRYFASLTLTQEKLYFIGGRRLFFDSFYGASKDVDVFDLRTQEWSIGGDYPVEIWEHQTCELYIPLTREDQVFQRPASRQVISDYQG